MVDGTAYLIQVTSNITWWIIERGIHARLADTLASLPAHLDVQFIWAVPPKSWAEKTLITQAVPAQKGARPATPGPERDSYDMVAERLEACKTQYKIPVDMVDALEEYRYRLSTSAEFSSVPSDSSDGPEVGYSGGIAAIPRIPAMTGRLHGADPKCTKVMDLSFIAFQANSLKVCNPVSLLPGRCKVSKCAV